MILIINKNNKIFIECKTEYRSIFSLLVMLRDATHDMPRLYDAVPAFYHSSVVYIVYYIALVEDHILKRTKSI